MTNRPVIAFTRDKLVALKVAYHEALQAGEKQFTFEGHEMLTDYAKYVIQYLEGEFK